MLWPHLMSSPCGPTTLLSSPVCSMSPRPGSSDPWFVSKNIRVWKNCMEFFGFKSDSGLVKAIVISSERIFTGYQDVKIRRWKVLPKGPTVYKGVRTLPRLKTSSRALSTPRTTSKCAGTATPSGYGISTSCPASASTRKADLLYSCLWDKTMKVWRISDSKCLESLSIHDDANNSMAVGSTC